MFLINAKAAAQRAMFDKEVLYKSVEQVMAETVSARMQVAQAVVAVERAPLLEPTPAMETIPEPGHTQPQHGLTMANLFQRHSAQPAGRRGRKSPPVAAQQLSLFGAGRGRLASAV